MQLPSWQIILAVFGFAYLIRHKCVFLMGKYHWLDRMLECTFCLGGHGGWLAWLGWAGLTGEWPGETIRANVILLVFWVLIGAGSAYLLDAVVGCLSDRIEGENHGPEE